MISTKQLRTIIDDCLFNNDELNGDTPPKGAVLTEGVVKKFGWHPERLESHRSEIAGVLAELPIEFHKGTGGGWSFLNAPTDKNGRQWGEQADAEMLLCLGMGLGYVTCQLPREMWPALPGGVPYYVIDLKQAQGAAL